MDRFRMPEVSVISSWAVRTRNDRPPIDKLETDSHALKKQLEGTPLPGLDYALREGIEVLDLYLLDNHEIPIYAGFARFPEKWNNWKAEDDSRQRKHDPQRGPFVSTGKFATPTNFLASLNRTQLDDIARCLQERLAKKYKGRGIGRRPRITGIATYFPYVSLPACFGSKANFHRQNSVRALRAALYLAHRLGAHCVEAVCGTWVALPNSTVKESPDECRLRREEALVQSIYDVFADNPFGDTSPVPVTPNLKVLDAPPYLALEIEPGVPYLLSNAQDYTNLLEKLGKHEKIAGTEAWQMVQSRVGLNADLAHFFLTGMHHPALFENLHKYLFHAHLSDHAGDARIGGIHASDLVPGAFHDFFNYEPWLKVLCDKKATPKFSGVIAIEQESSLQIEDVIAARSIVQRWLNICSAKNPRKVSRLTVESVEDRPHEGAFLVIDIGNSTSEFLNKRRREKNEALENWQAARTLNTVVEALCHEVRSVGGSALSFTGDGLVILFEERLLPGLAARIAVNFANDAIDFVMGNKGDNCMRVKKEVLGKSLTLRCGLHWGTCYIPTEGTLRDNGIGRDIVYASRLCNWLGETIERAAQRKESDNQIPEQNISIGATENFVQSYKHQVALTDTQGEVHWLRWGEPLFKGLPIMTVYLQNNSNINI